MSDQQNETPVAVAETAASTPTPAAATEPRKPQVLGRLGLMQLAGKPAKVERVDLADIGDPDISGIVFLKRFKTREKDDFEASLYVGKPGKEKFSLKDMRSKMLVRGLVNEDGSRMFKDNDLSVVADLPAHVSDFLFKKLRDLNNVSDEDIDEMAGNSSDDDSAG